MPSLAGWIRTWSPTGVSGSGVGRGTFMIVVWGVFCRISGKILPKRRSLVAQAGGMQHPPYIDVIFLLDVEDHAWKAA
jgi:hypothetical protein